MNYYEIIGDVVEEVEVVINRVENRGSNNEEDIVELLEYVEKSLKFTANWLKDTIE